MLQLNETEKQYKILFDHAKDSMMMVDAEGVIVAANKRQEEVLSYPRDVLIGQRFSFLLHEEDKKLFTDLFGRTLKGEKTPTTEVDVLSLEKSLLTMEMDLTGIEGESAVSSVQVHLRDVTERKILEREIAFERNKLETIIESMGEGSSIVGNDFRIQFMNKRFLELFGERSIGKRCHEVYIGKDRPCDECPVVKGIERSGTLEVSNLQGQTFQISHSPFKNLDGTVTVLEIFKDITEKKRLEQQLLRAERMAALSHFSSTLAHDLRNPIIGIRQRLRSLQSTIESSIPEAVNRVLTDVISGSELLLGMVNDVLDVYRNSYEELPLIISAFPFAEAVEDAIKLLQIEAEEKGVNVRLQSGDKSIVINGDKRRLQRVFINLLDNAIKFSSAGSKIEIRFERDGEGCLLFKIEDEGIGIHPSEMSSIFEPLYKVGQKKSKTGTGLGLHFCKVVVDAHGGNIWAENVREKGAAFYIKLPLEVKKR